MYKNSPVTLYHTLMTAGGVSFNLQIPIKSIDFTDNRQVADSCYNTNLSLYTTHKRSKGSRNQGGKGGTGPFIFAGGALLLLKL